jgi:hypothetical protein
MVYFFEILLVIASIAIMGFAAFAIYRVLTDGQ